MGVLIKPRCHADGARRRDGQVIRCANNQGAALQPDARRVCAGREQGSQKHEAECYAHGEKIAPNFQLINRAAAMREAALFRAGDHDGRSAWQTMLALVQAANRAALPQQAAHRFGDEQAVVNSLTLAEDLAETSLRGMRRRELVAVVHAARAAAGTARRGARASSLSRSYSSPREDTTSFLAMQASKQSRNAARVHFRVMRRMSSSPPPRSPAFGTLPSPSYSPEPSQTPPPAFAATVPLTGTARQLIRVAPSPSVRPAGSDHRREACVQAQWDGDGGLRLSCLVPPSAFAAHCAPPAAQMRR